MPSCYRMKLGTWSGQGQTNLPSSSWPSSSWLLLLPQLPASSCWFLPVSSLLVCSQHFSASRWLNAGAQLTLIALLASPLSFEVSSPTSLCSVNQFFLPETSYSYLFSAYFLFVSLFIALPRPSRSVLIYPATALVWTHLHFEFKKLCRWWLNASRITGVTSGIFPFTRLTAQ